MVDFQGGASGRISSVNLSQKFFPGTLEWRKGDALPSEWDGSVAFHGCGSRRGWNNLPRISPHPYPGSRAGWAECSGLEGNTADEPGGEEGAESPGPSTAGTLGRSLGQFLSAPISPSSTRSGNPVLLWTLAKCRPARGDSRELGKAVPSPWEGRKLGNVRLCVLSPGESWESPGACPGLSAGLTPSFLAEVEPWVWPRALWEERLKTRSRAAVEGCAGSGMRLAPSTACPCLWQGCSGHGGSLWRERRRLQRWRET